MACRRPAIPVRTRTVSIVLCALGLAACAPTPKSDAMSASNIPAAIAVPTGSKLFFTLRASGSQNYECRAKAGAAGSFDWTFVGPEAALYDKSDTLVGRHSSGPTWEYSDDSKVTGKVVADSPSSVAGNIPWLLLQGTPAPRSGVMSGITYIQRVNTNGGVAPSDPCAAATVGTKKAVHYAADYLFYKS